MPNPLGDVLPLLSFWREHWQDLLLGLLLTLGLLGLLFSGLVGVILFLLEYRKHRSAWAARRNTQQFFKENVTAPALAYLLLFPVAGALWWPFQVSLADAKKEKTVEASLDRVKQERDAVEKERDDLRGVLDRKRNVPDFNDPYFGNVIGGFRAFMTYRRTIGVGTSCMFLITAPPDSADVEHVLMYIGVYGANCPNGNLQNIHMTPEESEAASMKGVPDGVVVFHAPSTWQGATELMDALSGLVEMRRDYHLPKEAPDNYIWFQIGHNVKFKSQKR